MSLHRDEISWRSNKREKGAASENGGDLCLSIRPGVVVQTPKQREETGAHPTAYNPMHYYTVQNSRADDKRVAG